MSEKFKFVVQLPVMVCETLLLVIVIVSQIKLLEQEQFDNYSKVVVLVRLLDTDKLLDEEQFVPYSQWTEVTF